LNSELACVNFEDPEKAWTSVELLRGYGISDEELEPLFKGLAHALMSSPDPDRSLTSFVSWFRAQASPRSYFRQLITKPQSLDLFCMITGCSHYFADLLVKTPEYFSIIEDPGERGGVHSAASMYRHISGLLNVCRSEELMGSVLRRWKASQMLRIGVRDLAGLADMPTTAREFSHLADASVEAALDIARRKYPLDPQCTEPGFAVIGMGKLGGEELNYSSDIDLVFVHDDDLPYEIKREDGRTIETITYLNRIAETLIRILSEETADGHVFRVDMRLRPEGRFGPLTRSLSGFRAYYESWAEGWEFQSLIKARFVAGDRNVGDRYFQLITPYVYRNNVSLEVLTEVRENKKRIEQKCALEGETFTNVKTGFGGIRDVEFLVQALQLEHGGRYPRVRSANTLTALQRLHRAHLLSDSDTRVLADGYIFMRNLEHRLQLLNSFQVQNLPEASNAIERTKVALRMGFPTREAFEEALERHRIELDEIKNRVFYRQVRIEPFSTADGDWSELPILLDNLTSESARERIKSLLTQHGFNDIPSAFNAFQLPMSGNDFGEMPPDTPAAFKKIAARLVGMCAKSCNPDAALAGIEMLALAVPNRAQLYAAFADSPDVLDRLVRLGAGSPPLLRRLAGHLEWLETLLSPEEDAPADVNSDINDNGSPHDLRQNRTASLVIEMRRRLSRARPGTQIDAISAVFQREALLIGAKEIWEDTDSFHAMQDLTALADATLQILVEHAAETAAQASHNPAFAKTVLERTAIVGLGKLGGCELGYASDWDLIVAYEPVTGSEAVLSPEEQARLVERMVSLITDFGQQLITRGAHVEIDLRLRPWGRSGVLALSPDDYLEYYNTSGETWERQAAVKARFAAGNKMVGSRLMRVMHTVSFGHGLSSQEDQQIREMKKRIESERLKAENIHTDVKLGHGGMMDIEWLAQKLQLAYGQTFLNVRSPETLTALSALAANGQIDNQEADLLAAAYRLLFRVRNALWLQLGRSQDSIPPAGPLLRAVALQLGYRPIVDSADSNAEDALLKDISRTMCEVRCIFDRRFQAPAVTA
jgi:[glutamine synthetase] adenylyltransferase / [glutamine synthetase]-adenylyl-L-tyrosine phosphorylase